LTPPASGRPPQSFTWNGRGNNGVTWPDGSYTISIGATGANASRVGVSTQVQGVVSAVDVGQTSAHRGRAKGADQPDPIDQR
jgi:flagellar hook assembly protein FlgD